MKNLIIFFLILFSFTGAIGQAVIIRTSGNNTVSDARQIIQLNFILPRFADTTQANISIGIDSCGALIYTYDTKSAWLRQCDPKKWVNIGSVSGNNNLDTIWTRLPIFVDITSDPPKRILTLLHANGLLSGGIVTLDSCMSVDVTPPIYFLNYIQYTAAATLGLALAPADPTFPRIDIVVADSFGIVSIITGTPSATPVAPQINPSSQVLLTPSGILVPAGATCLPVTQEIIYDGIVDDPAQWDTASAGTISVDFSNTDNPYHLAQAGFIQTYTDGASITFTKPSGTDTVKASSILKGFIYILGLFTNQIQGQWFNGSVAASNSIVLNPYFNQNDSNQYQIFAPPLSAWSWVGGSVFNKLVLTFAGDDVSGAKGLYLDYLQLQTGLTNVATNLQLTTIGTSGAATLIDNVLNIPIYSGGGGGGGEAIDLTLRIGNTTKQTYRVVDSVATASGGGLPSPFTLWPQNYLTAYGGIIGTQGAFSHGGYGYYPLVNSDGRPNVVYQLFGYNGGYGSSTIAGEASAGMRFESHFNSGGRTLIESIGFFPEIVPRSGQIRRLGATYSDDSTGYSNVVFHIDGVDFQQGNTDTTLFGLDPINTYFGYNTNGAIHMINERIPTNQFQIVLGDFGASLSTTGLSNATSYLNFSPSKFVTSATLGSTETSAVIATVGTANYNGFKVLQTGLSSSDFKGYYADVATSGTFDILSGRNLTAAGTIETKLQANQAAGIAQNLLGDQDGYFWYNKYIGGTNQKTLYWTFNGADSLLKIRGDNGNVFVKYNLSIGTANPTARLMLPAGTATAAKAPLKFTTASAALLTTPEAGAMEVLVDSLYYTGSSGTRYKIYPGSGGGGTLQQATDASIAAVDNPFINVHSDNFKIDSVGNFDVTSPVNVTQFSLHGDAENSTFENINDTLETGIYNHIEPTIPFENYTRIRSFYGETGGSQNEQLFDVTPGYVKFYGLFNNEPRSKVIFENTDTLLTTPTYVYVPDNDTMKVYPIATLVDLPIANSFSQVGAVTTVFTVTIGSTRANNTYKVNVTPTNALSAALFYVTNKTTTTFDVTYLAGLTGTVTFDWALFP